MVNLVKRERMRKKDGIYEKGNRPHSNGAAHKINGPAAVCLSLLSLPERLLNSLAFLYF
jgi:hypothetical protein